MIDQHKTLAEKFLKKGFWLYLFSFIIAPIGYVIKIIVSGELSVSEVGILYGIISLITMISAYNDIGMGESLKFFIPQFIEKKQYQQVKSLMFFALGIQIITAFLISAFFYFGAEHISINYFKTNTAKETLQIFAFFFIGLNIFQTINNFFMAIQDTFYTKLTELIRIIFTLLSVIFIYLGDFSSLVNYSYSWLIGLYCGIVAIILVYLKKYYFVYLNKEKLIFDKILFKQILKYAGVIVISSGAGTILGQMDMQMIIYFLGTIDAGFYTNYLSIITIPFILVGPILAFLFPVISEMHGKGEISKIKLIKNIFAKNFIAIGIMFNIFFFVFAQIIAYTLFGEKFIESGNILQYSILLLIFNFLLQINFNILAGIGKVGQRVKIIFAAIVFNFIMNILLINVLGVYGAALATGLGWVLIFILSEFFLRKDYLISLQYKNILKNIFIMGGLGLIIHLHLIPILLGISRLESFISLALIFLVWTLVFIGINLSTFQGFIGEIKRLKEKS